MSKKEEASSQNNTQLSDKDLLAELSSLNGTVKELVEKNIKWSQVLYKQNKKMSRRLTFMAVGSYVRLLIILAPIILGIIYLPRLIDEVQQKYAPFLGPKSEATQGLPGGVGPINEIMRQLQSGQIDPDVIEKFIKNLTQ